MSWSRVRVAGQILWFYDDGRGGPRRFYFEPPPSSRPQTGEPWYLGSDELVLVDDDCGEDPEEHPRMVARLALRIFGLSVPFTCDDLRQAYRELVFEHHPDRGGDPERMKAINAAFDSLREHAR